MCLYMKEAGDFKSWQHHGEVRTMTNRAFMLMQDMKLRHRSSPMTRGEAERSRGAAAKAE